MQSTRRITLLLTLAVLAIAATYYPGGLGRFYGTDNLTNLVTGAVYFQTDSNTFWVGGVSSNPVKVGDAAWSNNVTATVTNGLATTNYVNGLTGGLTTNLSVLTVLPTTFSTLYFTNGTLKAVTTP
jgi:hypothetical protein